MVCLLSSHGVAFSHRKNCEPFDAGPEFAIETRGGTRLVRAEPGGQFTVAGTFGTSAGHLDVVVWTSANGAVWKAVTPAGEGLTGAGIQEITSLTASGNTLTGVGYTASPSSEQPVFWQSPIR